MGQWVHRLLVDSKTGQGTCAACGPIQAAWRCGRWKCPVASRAGRRGTPAQKAAQKKRRRTRHLQGDLACAICKKHLTIDTARVDHDHAICNHTGKGYFAYCPKCVRGVLCSGCNTGIGNLKDSPLLLRQAAEYIEQHRQTRPA